jgi:hypothetical protein
MRKMTLEQELEMMVHTLTDDLRDRLEEIVRSLDGNDQVLKTEEELVKAIARLIEGD